MSSNSDSLEVKFIDKDFDIAKLDDPAWKRAKTVDVCTYWSGEKAPVDRHFSVQLLWSKSALYIRFTAAQNEPLVVDDKPDLIKKSIGLWDRDVCEIFIATDAKAPNKYFEFEIAPNGEWVDLSIEVLATKRITDWDYNSGMESAARIEKRKIISAIEVEWASLGKRPAIGDIWRGNLFRCVGTGPTRGYLAWQPTMTPQAAFHVPSKFGKFKFVR
jgi:hypothetical protein